MLTIKWNGVDRLLKDFAKARQEAVPYAMRSALTTTAFEARRIWQGKLRENFTLRNQYTERSIIAVKASGKGALMQSSVGSFAEYMGDQEDGAQVHGKSGHKGIPTAGAAGQAPGGSRTRVVRAGNRLGAIHAQRGVGHSIKQRNASALAMAARRGKPFVLLQRKDGAAFLFKMTGGKRRWTGKKFITRRTKLTMLWNFSRSSVHVPGSHTLGQTLRAIEPKYPSIMQAAIVDQLRRHHVLGF